MWAEDCLPLRDVAQRYRITQIEETNGKKWTSGFGKGRGISWPAERLLASHVIFCSLEQLYNKGLFQRRVMTCNAKGYPGVTVLIKAGIFRTHVIIRWNKYLLQFNTAVCCVNIILRNARYKQLTLAASKELVIKILSKLVDLVQLPMATKTSDVAPTSTVTRVIYQCKVNSTRPSYSPCITHMLYI